MGLHKLFLAGLGCEGEEEVSGGHIGSSIHPLSVHTVV